MRKDMLLRKTCSIYASDLHFATVIFPYISKEIEKDTTIKTILERDEKENIEKIIENIGLNLEIKEQIKQIDWQESDITKIRKIFKDLEGDIKNNKKVDIIILGSNIFIQKVNKAIDLWFKNKMEEIEKKSIELNIINCFSFEEKQEIDKIFSSHDYILKTSGIEEVIGEEELQKAN